MGARPADLVRSQPKASKLSARTASPPPDDGQGPTGGEVLRFLHDLRFDHRRSTNLNFGRHLVREAARAGLAGPAELEDFIARMVELRQAGLVGWTCARSDFRGDDLLHAVQFYVTTRGRSRLLASGGTPREGRDRGGRGVLATVEPPRAPASALPGSGGSRSRRPEACRLTRAERADDQATRRSRICASGRVLESVGGAEPTAAASSAPRDLSS
jgi:hypothetical protein